MVAQLSDEQREKALADLEGWRWNAGAKAISRRFDFGDFSEAFAFMTRVALIAETVGHHPDWSNSYDKVTIALSTHDAGGVTDRDIDMARRIEALLV